MSDESILRIECDCKIIRPIYIKNHNFKINDLEMRETKKSKTQKIIQ